MNVPVFIGEYRHNMDAKGRVAMPAKFRSSLGASFRATVGLDQCIAIYTEEEFSQLFDKLKAFPFNNRDARQVERAIMGNARECEPDAQGRILLPANLIAYAKLGKECAIVGVGDHVEIWNAETWEINQNENLTKLSDIAEGLPEIH